MSEGILGLLEADHASKIHFILAAVIIFLRIYQFVDVLRRLSETTPHRPCSVYESAILLEVRIKASILRSEIDQYYGKRSSYFPR